MSKRLLLVSNSFEANYYCCCDIDSRSCFKLYCLCTMRFIFYSRKTFIVLQHYPHANSPQTSRHFEHDISLSRLLLQAFFHQIIIQNLSLNIKQQTINQIIKEFSTINPYRKVGDSMQFNINQMNYNYDVLLKYILIGDSGTGKSSLIHRFLTNNYKQLSEPTLAAEFAHKMIKVGDMAVKIMLWDTAGQQTFRSMVRCYYKNCIVAIVVYDATKRYTFQHISNWLQQIEQNCHDSVRVILVGNKTDLTKLIQVTSQQGKAYAESKGFAFYETSAATGDNVQAMFQESAQKLVEDFQQKRLTILPNMDMGVRFSNRPQVKPSKQSVEINIKGSHPKGCLC